MYFKLVCQSENTKLNLLYFIFRWGHHSAASKKFIFGKRAMGVVSQGKGYKNTCHNLHSVVYLETEDWRHGEVKAIFFEIGNLKLKRFN